MLRSTHKINKIFSTPTFLEMPSFGLDISDDSVKYMNLKATRYGVRPDKYGEKKIPKGALELGKIVDREKLVGVLQELKKELNIKDARVSILENQIYLFKLKLEREGLISIKENIELVLEEHIPIPGPEAIFDYELLEETDKELVLQVAAIQIDTIEEYLSIFEEVGISIHSFEIEAQAIARAIVKNGDKDTYMILDFGGSRTGIFIVSSNIVRFATTVDFGGIVFSQLVEKSLNVSFEEAENIKKEYGLQRNLENKEIFPILLNSASILKDEIMKHFVYWHTHEDEDGIKNPSIRKILFCGGNSSIPGLLDYFAMSMKVDVELANVWTNIVNIENETPEIDAKVALSFATAIGLALRDFEHD